MLHLLSLWLVSAAPAETPTVPDSPTGLSDEGPGVGAATDVPSGSPATGDPPADDGAFVSVLEHAKQSYFRGEDESARELLQGLQLRLYAGEAAEWDQVVEAMTWLGEIYYVEGDQEQAEAAFRYLLDRDPNTSISPYNHPIDVVNLFELVRTTVIKARLEAPPPVPIAPPPPTPVWVFAPLGVPQFAQRRPAAGLAYGGLQAGLAAASVGLRFYLTDLNKVPKNRPVDEALRSQVQRMRYTYQWPATFGFYVAWGISSLDAARYHQRHPPTLTIGSSPDGTPTVGIGGEL